MFVLSDEYVKSRSVAVVVVVVVVEYVTRSRVDEVYQLCCIAATAVVGVGSLKVSLFVLTFHDVSWNETRRL